MTNLIPNAAKRLWGRYVLRHRRKRSPLKEELKNLQRKIKGEEIRLEEAERDFWADGGMCCPYCGIPWWREAQEKQERRRQRVTQIVDKLIRDNPKDPLIMLLELAKKSADEE